MPKKVWFGLLFSIFLSAFLSAATAARAQAKFCPVKLEVTSNNGETSVTGATATALNTKTKTVYRSVLRGGMPYFAKLPQGSYRVTVSKIGFKRTIDDFGTDCAEEDNGAWAIELFKGSSRQVVRAYETNTYSIGAANVPPLRAEPVNEGRRYETLPSNSGTSSTLPQQYKVVSGGVVNGKAVNLVKPPYPPAARAVRAAGAVNVQVTIDENGNVISAQAITGHPLLRAAAVQAARASTFSPTRLEGQPVKVTGVIVYNFVP